MNRDVHSFIHVSFFVVIHALSCARNRLDEEIQRSILIGRRRFTNVAEVRAEHSYSLLPLLPNEAEDSLSSRRLYCSEARKRG